MTPEPSSPGRRLTRKQALRWLGGIGLALGAVLAVIGWATDAATLIELGWLCLALGAIWLICSWFTCDEPMTVADRSYLRQLLPAALVYTALTLLVFPLAPHIDRGWLKVLVAILPVLPALAIARAMVLRMLAGDELERRIQLEATSVAALVVGCLSLSTGFLQAADVIELEDGLIWVFPGLIAVWGLALWWARRRYQSE